MKNLILLVLVCMVVVLVSCKDSHKNEVQPSPNSQVYYCPMHPEYTAGKPGNCPICGMSLVLREDGPPSVDREGRSDLVGRAPFKLSTDKQQKIGVTTAQVVRKEAIKDIRASARVAYDPDFVTAQREYLEAKRLNDSSILSAARQRLKIMGMSTDEIDKLKDVESGHVVPGKSFWVYPLLYEYELHHVRLGQNVTVELSNGENFNGTIRYVDSVIDPSSRTAKLHVEVDAKGGAKPEMSGVAIVHIDLGESLVVPKSAVISTGERNVVFVVHDGMHFMPTEVKLGPELGDEYVVESGLNEGDMVVTGATFLIDSESKLKAALESTGAPVPAEHKH